MCVPAKPLCLHRAPFERPTVNNSHPATFDRRVLARLNNDLSHSTRTLSSAVHRPSIYLPYWINYGTCFQHHSWFWRTVSSHVGICQRGRVELFTHFIKLNNKHLSVSVTKWKSSTERDANPILEYWSRRYLSLGVLKLISWSLIVKINSRGVSAWSALK